MTKEKKDRTEQKVKQLEDQLKRALADYDNLKKRAEEERHNLVKFANTVLIVKFLDVLDILEEAQKNLNDPGLELVIRKFKEILASENIEEIEAKDKDFDPNHHEAVSVIDGETNNQVVEVLQKGYQIAGRVIRPARVKVTRKAEIEGQS
jgi:molecular chaperone GrpE